MDVDKLKELKKLTNEHIHAIWEIAKTGELDSLSNEERWLAKTMLDHQDEYFNQFEMADLTYEHEYDVDTEVNPFLHVTIHSSMERQLEARDPIEAYQFYNAMRKKKLTHHETIHLMGFLFMPFLLDVMKNQKEFNLEKYRSLLKKFKNKTPEKIYDTMKEKG